uniref:Uncharacterized protein n=1 Tax=Picea glauca TaxID=3330 RepID=A0A117NG36_PICGL|nr:hypothetical protein ABT39_MTgene1967 [Picea glauca]
MELRNQLSTAEPTMRMRMYSYIIQPLNQSLINPP